VKTALLHKFKRYKKAVYVDVGGGIDALAGCIKPDRPYAHDWVNYRIKGFDYSKIDTAGYFYSGFGNHKFLYKTKKERDFLWAVQERKGGKLTKPFQYFAVYEEQLHDYRNVPLKILIIGEEMGFVHSLDKYFRNSDIFIIPDQSGQKSLGKKFTLIKADRKDKESLTTAMRSYGPFDLVFDCGADRMVDQINAFIIVFQFLRERGKFFIENLQTSYWKDYGGQIYSKASVVEMLKTMIDRLNWWAYRDSRAPDEARINRDLDYFEAFLESVIFYEGICVVTKSRSHAPRIYDNGFIKAVES
jgi:hypothetical protein